MSFFKAIDKFIWHILERLQTTKIYFKTILPDRNTIRRSINDDYRSVSIRYEANLFVEGSLTPASICIDFIFKDVKRIRVHGQRWT